MPSNVSCASGCFAKYVRISRAICDLSGKHTSPFIQPPLDIRDDCFLSVPVIIVHCDVKYIVYIQHNGSEPRDAPVHAAFTRGTDPVPLAQQRAIQVSYAMVSAASLLIFRGLRAVPRSDTFIPCRGREPEQRPAVSPSDAVLFPACSSPRAWRVRWGPRPAQELPAVVLQLV